MITIPEGKFIMGSTTNDIAKILKLFPDFEIKLLKREIPQHEVYLLDYAISKYPIANNQFGKFIKETNYVTTAEKEGTGFVFDPKFRIVKGADWKHPLGNNSNLEGKDLHPVVQVSWHDAIKFCSWLCKKTGDRYRLPTEAEWEKAAKGEGKRCFPWGDKWNPNFCNADFRVGDTTPVNCYEKFNVSPYGCVDMCGNVFEWTSTTTGITEPWPELYKYPYNDKDGRENLVKTTRRIGRGGSYSRNYVYCRNTFRFADPPTDRYSAQGFRIACDP